MGCSCGSAVWLNVTATVCIDSDQILGHLTQPDPGVKIGRGVPHKNDLPPSPQPPLSPRQHRATPLLPATWAGTRPRFASTRELGGFARRTSGSVLLIYWS